jgi:methylglutaconyl-CoA hydratase
LGTRQDVRAVVLQGNGKSFSAGADLKWTRRVSEMTPDENRRDARAAIDMFLTVMRCPKPVIARVHGAALGGGAGLVAACDIGIATAAVQFGFTEVKWGIVPALISPFVVARIGIHAREYFLTGAKFPAETALAMGLIQHVVPDDANLDAQIDATLAEIRTASPEAIAMTKELILKVAGQPVESMSETTAEVSVRSRASTAAQAGVQAFLSRGKPPWAPR